MPEALLRGLTPILVVVVLVSSRLRRCCGAGAGLGLGVAMLGVAVWQEGGSEALGESGNARVGLRGGESGARRSAEGGLGKITLARPALLVTAGVLAVVVAVAGGEGPAG